MFARVSTLFAMFFLGLALMVSATPAALKPVARDTIPASQCNTGDLQCCNTVENADSPSAAALLGLLGVVVQGLDVLVGLTCTPITVIGVGSGANCVQQPVCCENNNFNGLINIGCTPVNLGL
ncbi:fungal hydrophobin [Heterobasidion irregulare TC 32-1]|uniref:Class I hydrophobin 2 n=2 Tax=Heterobasidion annosum species complex TaxID=256003 RepID=HAH2_HETAN|nr:fungal hydrophobin [Heterobasidion irregulare TC 32-1]ABA46362.1 hydrophobin 2 [Heterobasidion annosum]ETW76644.1 fungal hydrophobin [Heterobasidion irregulare TC 32-1]